MAKAILFGLIVMMLTVLMDRSYRGEDFFKKTDDDNDDLIMRANWAGFDDPVTWSRAIGYGALVAIAVFIGGSSIAGRFLLIPLLCLIAMVGLMFQYAWWWGFARPLSIKSLLWFLVIEFALFTMAKGPAATLSTALAAKGWKFLANLSKGFPMLSSVICSWSAIVGLCRRSDKKVLATIFKWAALILIVIWLFGLIGDSSVDWGFLKTQTAANAAATPEPQPSAKGYGEVPDMARQPSDPGYGEVPNNNAWYTFYNLYMQMDNDTSNDLNFGPNPYRENWTVEDYFNDFCARLRRDPVLGAADMAYFDLMTGTQISGVVYKGNRTTWLNEINKRAEEFVSDHNLYEKTLEEFFKVLRTTEVKIKWYTDIKNLMFMDPCGRRNGNCKSAYLGMPLVIVKDTKDREAYFLVFEYKKGNSSSVIDVGYKIDCGYQPRNIPGEGNNPGGNNGGGGNVPPPQPPGLNKDPTQGTDVGGNDTSGPGPNTNNGVGATTSTADQPTNSSSMTYGEYKDEMTDMTTTADNQRVGGDPNTPTVQTPTGAVVDSNADHGTGNGGIDTPTSVEGYVQTDGGVAVGGQTETHIEMPD